MKPVIVGTSHISEQSVSEIEEAFEKHDPSIVCLELDHNRAHALLTDQKPSMNPLLIRKIGFLGYVFALVGGVAQKKLAKLVGATPGIEMLGALRLSAKNKCRVFLIDQNLELTLRNLSSKVPLREKLGLVKELLFGFFTNEKVSFDLSKVPEEKIIEKLTSQLKSKFPSLYKVLVGDRDKVMAKNVNKIVEENPEEVVLVVIGAGHLKGFTKLLK